MHSRRVEARTRNNVNNRNNRNKLNNRNRVNSNKKKIKINYGLQKENVTKKQWFW